MAYAIEITKLLTKTLSRLTTLHSFQLAGHVANLDFWLAEVKHSIASLDGYRKRFRAMKRAELTYKGIHGTVRFEENDPIPWDIPDPSQVPDEQISEARSDVVAAASRFLARCHKSGLLDAAALRESAESIGISAELDKALQ